MLIDSSAWTEYFMGTAKGEKAKKVIEGKGLTYTCAIVIAEIYSKSLRTDGAERAEERVNFIAERCVFIPLDEDAARSAGIIHGEMKAHIKDFGMADAFILAAARERNARILTSDTHFKDMEEAAFID